MSNQEILEKAIQKAIDGGWKPFPYTQRLHKIEVFEGRVFTEITFRFLRKLDGTVSKDWRQSLETTIFNHDFAKALWADDEVCITCGQPHHVAIRHQFLPEEVWKKHLQQMVIADDPIKYLGEHLG